MKDQVDRFIEHAVDALDDANFLHQHGRVLALANRACYAVFYCTCALLLIKGVKTEKHERTRVEFTNSL